MSPADLSITESELLHLEILHDRLQRQNQILRRKKHACVKKKSCRMTPENSLNSYRNVYSYVRNEFVRCTAFVPDVTNMFGLLD